MMRSLFSAVSGLKNHQTAMDVIGNNVANVNTVGYKSSRVIFQDIYSQTVSSASAPTESSGGINAKQVGLGVTTSAISTNMTEGSTQTTSATLDFAISGEGYFIVKSSDGGYYYTRNGNFKVDEEGYLTTQNGDYVMGKTGTGVLVPAVTTTSFTLKGSATTVNAEGTFIEADTDDTTETNLASPADLTDATLLAAAKKVLNTGNYDGTYNITVTSDGATTPTYTWTATNTKDTTITLSGAYDASTGKITFSKPEVTTTSGGTTTTTPAVPLFTIQVQDKDGTAAGTLSTLQAGTLTNAFTITTEEPAVQTNGIADADSNLTLDNLEKLQITGTIGADSVYGEVYYGDYSQYSIDSYGVVTGTREKEDGTLESIKLGRVALATFANSEGLEKVGNSNYEVSANSGDPQVEYVSVDCGKINSGSLEMSNVDLATEMTSMIVTQRGFQANSRVITTSDTMLEELVNLKR